MDNIKDIIHQVMGKMAERKPDEQNKLDRIWLNILEGKESEHTKLIGEKNGWLSVHVDSPAWLYQMNTRRKKILERITEEIPEIRGIRFKIGKIK